jgi:hypothetical protein
MDCGVLTISCSTFAIPYPLPSNTLPSNATKTEPFNAPILDRVL